jgi:hypothetical protein
LQYTLVLNNTLLLLKKNPHRSSDGFIKDQHNTCFITLQTLHKTEIKMAKMVEMVEIVEIILIWTFPKVEMAEITSYYIILIRYK